MIRVGSYCAGWDSNTALFQKVHILFTTINNNLIFKTLYFQHYTAENSKAQILL